MISRNSKLFETEVSSSRAYERITIIKTISVDHLLQWDAKKNLIIGKFSYLKFSYTGKIIWFLYSSLKRLNLQASM